MEPPLVRGPALELLEVQADDRMLHSHGHRFLVDWSADGERLVTAQKDAVFAWESRTGRLQHAVPLQGGAVGANHLAVSPDGQRAAVEVVANKTAIRYEIDFENSRVTELTDEVGAPLRYDANGKLLGKMVPPASMPQGMLLSRWYFDPLRTLPFISEPATPWLFLSENQRYVAVLGETVYVWSIAAKARIGREIDAEGAVTAAVSNNGRLVALGRGAPFVELSGGSDGASGKPVPYVPHLDLWDLRQARRIWRIPGRDLKHGDSNWVFTRDDEFLTGPRTRVVEEIIRTATGEVLSFDDRWIRGVSPNSRFAAVQDHSGLSIITLDSQEVVFEGARRKIVAVSPDGTLRVSVGADGALQLERGEACVQLGQSLMHGRNTFAFTADNRYLLRGMELGPRGPHLFTWSADTGRLIQVVSAANGTRGVVHPLPATTEAVFQGKDGLLRFVDALSGRGTRTARPPRTAYGKHLPASNSVFPVRVSSWGQPDELGRRPIRATSDGRYLVVRSYINDLFTLSIWDTTTGGVVADIPLGFRVEALALSDDDRLLAVAGDGGQLRLWERESQKRRHLAKFHTGRATALAFAPGGRLLATAGQDHLVRVFDTENGEEIGTVDLAPRFDHGILLWFDRGGARLNVHTARGLVVRVRVINVIAQECAGCEGK